jgi:predicted DNA binding protein|tara:strand:+ start:300 stop:560 length:261 start_codon:yes stop_codon:yes gene_type:complete
MSEIELVIQAIRKINPNAQTRIVGETLDNCSIEWIVGNPISKDDIRSMLSTVEAEEKEIVDNKSSGKQKLKDLGLTDAEIKALTGA